MADSKKGIGLLIGLGPKKPGAETGADADDMDDDTSAAQAVLDAIKADDAAALKAALKLCYSEE